MTKLRLTTKRERAIFWMLINTVVWGAVAPLIKPALGIIDPFGLLFSRFLLAGLMILPIVIWYLYRQPRLWRTIPKIIFFELVGTLLSLGLLYVGLQKTDAVMASVLGATPPLFVTLGGLLFWHERETKNEWLGLVISLIGILLLTIEPVFLGSQSWRFGAIDGNMLILFSCITSAWYYLQIKRHYHHIPKLFAAGVSFLVGLVGFTIILLVQGHWSPQILVDTIWLWTIPTVGGAVFYMAVFVSIIGLTSYILGQDEIEASAASIFTYLQPMVAAPLAFWLLHEQITLLQVVLFTIIIFGVWVSQRRRRIKLSLPWKKRTNLHSPRNRTQPKNRH